MSTCAWVWVKGCWRPIMGEPRQIRRGHHKGDLQVELPDGKKCIVKRSATRGLPPIAIGD